MRIIKLNLFPVPVRYTGKLKFTQHVFAIFKNVVHILEPGEMQSNSVSHQVPNYAKRS